MDKLKLAYNNDCFFGDSERWYALEKTPRLPPSLPEENEEFYHSKYSFFDIEDPLVTVTSAPLRIELEPPKGYEPACGQEENMYIENSYEVDMHFYLRFLRLGQMNAKLLLEQSTHKLVKNEVLLEETDHRKYKRLSVDQKKKFWVWYEEQRKLFGLSEKNIVHANADMTKYLLWVKGKSSTI